VRIIARSYSANVLESVVDAVGQGWGKGIQEEKQYEKSLCNAFV
jgi:hypothetical protein